MNLRYWIVFFCTSAALFGALPTLGPRIARRKWGWIRRALRRPATSLSR